MLLNVTRSPVNAGELVKLIKGQAARAKALPRHFSDFNISN